MKMSRYQATQLATSTLPMHQAAVNLKGLR